MKIIINPGHGGTDPGIVANGMKEKDIVLDISKKVVAELSTYDCDLILYRSSDVFYSLDQISDYANKQKADLFLAVHVNGAGGDGGFESYRYTKASAESAAFQNVVHREIWSKISAAGVTIDRGQKQKNLHVLRETKMPAVLVECLFLDVAADAQRLRNPDIINAFVDGIVQGIVKYAGLKKKTAEKPSVPTAAAKIPAYKVTGRQFLIDKAGISEDWKATDQVDIGILGTILARLIK